jgi:hypothetical protein
MSVTLCKTLGMIYDKPTSEPSVSLPDCFQSSCEDIEDKETLDAPKFALVAIS